MRTAPPAGTVGLTYADLLDLPEPAQNRGTRYELLDGELLVTPAPAIRHQQSVGNIHAALHAHTRAHGGLALPAPTDVFFSDTTVLEPDVVALRLDTQARQSDAAKITVIPDLVVEVSSPSTRRTDLVRKRRVYEREGVPEFWFVDLDTDQVQCYRRGPDGTYGPPAVVFDDGILTSPVLDGFAMPAADALAVPDA
jgi:Uma2 family endonuclease